MHGIYYVLKRSLIAFFNPFEAYKAMKSVVAINEALNLSKNKVVFFDRFSMHYSFTAPIYEEFIASGNDAIFIVSDQSHLIYKKNSNEGSCFYLHPKYEFFLRFVKAKVIATPASHLPVFVNRRSSTIAHYFHSPVSMHYVYGDRAFDAYDVFFAVGSYHLEEFKLLERLRVWNNKVCYKAGYPKIDVIAKNYSNLTELRTNEIRKRKIAFAPSWLETSVLRSHGYEIVESLLLSGFQVILRPHKHSFDYDMDIINKLTTSFGSYPFKVDEGMAFDEIYDCDILISDWSGIAFEFAFGLGKPVISVDIAGARKIQSKLNTKIEADALEDIARFEIGLVSEPISIVENIEAIYSDGLNVWSQRLSLVREKYLYNFEQSSRVIADHLQEISLKKSS